MDLEEDGKEEEEDNEGDDDNDDDDDDNDDDGDAKVVSTDSDKAYTLFCNAMTEFGDEWRSIVGKRLCCYSTDVA
jgi:hypothetical protein